MILNTQTDCKFDVIAAVDEKWGIGRDGTIPWKETVAGKFDMLYFRNETKNCVVIMGSHTYADIGRPLRNRYNIVITSTSDNIKSDSPTYVKDFESALSAAYKIASCSTKIWVIGGASVYSQALTHPRCNEVYVSMIPGDFNCDVFFPKDLLPKRYVINTNILNDFTSESFAFNIPIHIYSRNTSSEMGYLRLVSNIIRQPSRPNRTGIHTRGLFAQSMRFNLTCNNELVMPLITTKKVPFKLVATELQWFLGGACTHTKQLIKQNNHIWDDNTTQEFHAKRGLVKYIPGECGPIYGYQWRHWNRKYISGVDSTPGGSTFGSSIANDTSSNDTSSNDTAMNKHGIDQLANVIQTLKTDPYDRRMIVSAWNPEQLGEMVLPPCHWSFQFHCDPISDNFGTQYPDLCGWRESTTKNNVEHTTTKPKTPKKYFLNCVVNMRSADMCLGVPFNIASYALLTHIVALIVNMVPGELVIHMTDCHVYENHIEGANEQIKRNPYDLPTFEFGSEIMSEPNPTLDMFATANQNQFIVKDYRSHPTIKYPMAI